MKTKSIELNQFIEEMETEEETTITTTPTTTNGGVKLGMWETILRNHHNSLKSLFHLKKPDSIITDHSSVNSPKPIPQLSPIANEVVSTSSKYYSPFIPFNINFFI